MKIYLAGPMRGIPLYNFPAFDTEAARLRSLGHIVFSPAECDRQDGFKPESDKAKTIDYYMAIDLPEVCKADAVVVLPGWQNSQGANIEVAIALEVGKKVFEAGTMNELLPGGVLALPSLKKVTREKGLAAQAITASPNEVRVTDASGGQKGVKLERFDLLPSWALREVARVSGFGETKYPSTPTGPNWRRGYKWGLSFGAMLRHCTLFWLGEDKDSESGLHHLAHAAWHCLTLMTFWREKLGTDDRWDKNCPEKS